MFSPENKKEAILRLITSSLHLVCFGCNEGELRPGLSGWMHEKAEVLELFTFWKPEQQDAHRFRIWRPLSKKLIEGFPKSSSIFSSNLI